MKTLVTTAFPRPVTGALALLALAAVPLQAAETLVLKNVDVLPMDTPRVLERQTLVVEDGVIAAIGDAAAIREPRGAKVVDGDGAFVMPGLSDMHAHIGGYADGEAAGVEVAANQLLLYLATGVTLLRDTSGSPAHFEYRRRLRAGELLGPDLYFTSPLLEGEQAVWEFALKVLDPAEAEPLLAQFAADGYWGVKVYHTLSAEVFDAVMAAAERHGLKVIGHVPFGVGVERALASGIYSIEHLRGYDFDGMSVQALAADGGRSAERFRSLAAMSEARMDELVAHTVLAGTWNTPTLAINRFLFDAGGRAALAEHPRFRRVHPNLQQAVVRSSALDEIFSAEARAALREVLPRQQELVRRLNAAGAGILIGTDAIVPAYVPGFTPIDEMQALAAGGMPVFDVLQAATLDAARSLGIEAERGTLAAGKQASLIMLERNPLEDLDALWSLRGVVHRGQWLSFAEIEDRLERQAAARAAAPAAGGGSPEAGTDRSAAQAEAGGFAFVNVNVIPVLTDGVLRERTVVVRGGRVETIGASGEVRLPAGLTVIDGAGGYLLPGLADMHTHPMTADDLLLYLANGVTLIRAMWGEPSLLELRDRVERGTLPGPRIRTSGRIVDGQPPIHFATTVLADPEDSANAANAANASEVLRRQMSAGFDFVKIYSRLSPGAFDALAGAAAAGGIEFSGHVPSAVPLDRALDSGMRTMEHLYGYLSFTQSDWVPIDLYRSFADPGAVAFMQALGRGEHDGKELLDRDRLASIAGKTAGSPVWIVPTLSVLRSIAGMSGAPSGAERYLSPGTRQMWSAAAEMWDSIYGPDYFSGQAALYRDKLRVVEALHGAGARILVGSDAPNPGVMPGFAVVEEIELLTEAGFSNAEAIRAATHGPALYMNEADERGHVTEGAIADLVLVAGNPLEDPAHLGNILGVMRSGEWSSGRGGGEPAGAAPGRTRLQARWFDAAELESMLQALAERSAALEARLDAAPVPRGPAPGRADFVGPDGGQLSLSASRSEEGLRVTAALKLDDVWERYTLARDEAGFTLASNGAEYRLSETGGRRRLLRDGEAVAEAAPGDLPALLSTGTHADAAMVHELTRALEIGDQVSLQVWRCERPSRCDRPAVETWRVRRSDDAVLDGHFYYTGVRVFELTTNDGEALGTMWIGGGFYEGQPVRMALERAAAVSRLKRVR